MSDRLLVACLLLVVAASDAPAQESRPVQAGVELRNPSALRVAQLLELGPSPRVRFEWDQVTGAQAYLLSGEWVTRQSWAKQSRRVRVTQTTAKTWTKEQVSIDLQLPAGSHSWKLVAVYGPDDLGNFERPAQLSFDVR